jgi:hypothetical protein
MSSMPGGGAGPSPALIWETVNAYQRTAALRAGVELGVFSRIGEGVDTAPAIAARCQASERGLRILCDFLTVSGLLTKENGRYRLTQDSAVFLDERSPAFMGSALRFINSAELIHAYDQITDVVRRGSTALKGAGVVESHNPVWINFAQNMVPIVKPATMFIAELAAGNGPLKVLDLAAGHGLFGIEVARRNPKAQIYPVDWPEVLEVAQENAQKAGVTGQYHPLPGDAFEVDFAGLYDLVLVTNFLHHFDRPTCEKLTKKIRADLAPGGKVITLEFVPNEDRVSPPAAATFSMMMLGLTPSGDAYTFREIAGMYAAAGFQHNELMEVPQSPESIVISTL